MILSVVLGVEGACGEKLQNLLSILHDGGNFAKVSASIVIPVIWQVQN